MLLVAASAAHVQAAPNDADTSWRAFARLVDEESHASWQRADIEPAPRAGDGEYLRRVTLDLVGRTPTTGEALEFLTDRDEHKRERLVDRLLDSPAHPARWADIYLGLLVPAQQRASIERSGSRRWLIEQLAANIDMSALVTALLTATGTINEGPAFFVASRLTGSGGIEDLAGTTARVFLGLQLQCAQCHDHPYDRRFKQDDFRRFAAFFGDSAVRPDHTTGDRVLVDGSGKKSDFRDLEPAFFGARPSDATQRRAALARAIVGTRRFAQVTVAFHWQQLFGAAPVDAWDDLEDAPPRLLVRLARAFGKSGFDRRALLKGLVTSRTYQRTSRNTTAKQRQHFAAARVRVLSPEQLLESLLWATGFDRDAQERDPADRTNNRRNRWLRELRTVLGEGAEDAGSMPRALLERNGVLTSIGARAHRGSVLARIYERTTDPALRLDWLFLTALTRQPTAAESERLLEFLQVRGDARSAYEDLFHALLTSTEFTTNH